MVNFAKINLTKRDWIDIVFEGRNKKYGAYVMRRRSSKTAVWAMIMGIVFFTLLMSAPMLIRELGGATGGGKKSIDETVTLVDLLPPPDVPKDEVFIPPPPPKEIKSITEVKKFTPPVVASEDEVIEEMVTQKELETAIAGSKNIDASADGDVMIDETPVEHIVEKQITEDTRVHDMKSVQVQPEYPGGMAAFIKFVIDNMGNIRVDSTNDLKLEFRFVIEKDGKLTDIKVINDGGYPDIAKLATNVLSWSPKWEPGVINGKPVRVAYVLPMTIRMQ